MIVEETSKPVHKSDLAIVREVEAMERMPSHWSSESVGDKASCAVPMMIYRDALKSKGQDSPVKTGRKFSTSSSQLSLSTEFDMDLKDSEHSSSSSTATITTSWENAPIVSGSNKNMVVSREDEGYMGNGVDHPSKKAQDVYVKSASPLHRSTSDQTQHKQGQQKGLAAYMESGSPVEANSSISVASDDSESTSSSTESRVFYHGHEKSLSKSGVSDSTTSSGVLNIADFTVSSVNLTPGLIHTAYSRLKDRDMLYRKRIKELEKEVKKVPVLEMKLATLKEENELLLLQLKFCSGRTGSSGFGDDLSFNDNAYCSSNSGCKHMSENNKSSGSFANSLGSSGVSEIGYSELPSEKDRRTSQIASSVGSEMRDTRASAIRNGVKVKQNSELQGKTDSQNKEITKCEASTLSELSAHCNSPNLHKQGKFCLKCPRCSFRISDETLQLSVRKDQIVQTDSTFFTLERGTQTSGDESPKNQPIELFIQNLEKFLCETRINKSEQPAPDPIINTLRYIAHYMSDDPKQCYRASVTAPAFNLTRATLTDFFSPESSSLNALVEATADPMKTESSAVHVIKEMHQDLTGKNSRWEISESFFDKTPKENNQLRACSTKNTWSDTLEADNSGKGQLRYVDSETATTQKELIHPARESASKTKRELRSIMPNHVPMGPFLPPPKDCRTSSGAQNGRSTSSSSQRSEFSGYDTGSFSTENERNEKVQAIQNENVARPMYDISDCDSNNEAENIGNHNYDESQHMTIADEINSVSDSASYHTPENNEGSQSPSMESEPSGDSEMVTDIPKEQEICPTESMREGSQVFVVQDVQEELVFPDEVKVALQRIHEYLLNPKENTDKKSLHEPVDLIKSHWFGIIRSSRASPGVVQQYLNEVSQYSSVLTQWIINLHDGFGNSILHFAAGNKQYAVLDALLKTELCNVNKRNKAGFTGAMLASANKLESELDRQVMKKLLRKSDLNARSYEHGETALTLASGHGIEDIVELLLEAGADVNIQDKDGSTALMYAAEHGNLGIVRRLVVHRGSDLHLRDDDGIDACSVALNSGHPDVALLIYLHSCGDHLLLSNRKRPEKCKKWPKSSSRQCARHYSRDSASKDTAE